VLKFEPNHLSLSAKALNINLVEMIKTIRIQNFRSLQDVTLDLQDVNLLIGPNNSGKTNLMKAFRFLGEFFERSLNLSKDNLQGIFFLRLISESDHPKNQPIAFTITYKDVVYRIELYGVNENGEVVLNQLVGFFENENSIQTFKQVNLNDIPNLKSIFYNFSLQVVNNKRYLKHVQHDVFFNSTVDKNIFILNNKGGVEGKYRLHEHVKANEFILCHSFSNSYESFFNDIYHAVRNCNIYSINISSLKRPYPTLEDDYSVKPDASNLVAFLDNMRDNKPHIMEAINSHLSECIKEFKSITFEKVRLTENDDLVKIYGNKTFKRLGVQDKFGQIYWVDELSDGTLYFLALLAIIHQPEPPKLLMIEEPENGIHPRRIKEIIDYFFNIAEEKGIQVILTTHSTVVIDQFKDMPESIFVFDKKDQATQVKNLLTDIIEEDKELSIKNNVPPLDLSGSLGDHWAAGLIGGVPR
jgi:predicted ATPase